MFLLFAMRIMTEKNVIDRKVKVCVCGGGDWGGEGSEGAFAKYDN